MVLLEKQMKNIEKAIAIMKRAGEVDMEAWQGVWQEPVYTEEAAHECGTVCCLGGWIALSPEFHADGGSAGRYGEPIIVVNKITYANYEAIAEWLDISENKAAALCMVLGDSAYEMAEPSKEDVIAVLEKMLEKHLLNG
jgi:hypothetical protein